MSGIVKCALRKGRSNQVSNELGLAEFAQQTLPYWRRIERELSPKAHSGVR